MHGFTSNCFKCFTCKCKLTQCDLNGDICYDTVDVALPSKTAEPGTFLGNFALFKCSSEICIGSATHSEYPHKNRKMLCRCTKCLLRSGGKGIVRAYEKRMRDFNAGHYRYGGDGVAEEGNSEFVSTSNSIFKRRRLVRFT